MVNDSLLASAILLALDRAEMTISQENSGETKEILDADRVLNDSIVGESVFFAQEVGAAQRFYERVQAAWGPSHI